VCVCVCVCVCGFATYKLTIIQCLCTVMPKVNANTIFKEEIVRVFLHRLWQFVYANSFFALAFIRSGSRRQLRLYSIETYPSQV